jgi:hypothetical protein
MPRDLLGWTNLQLGVAEAGPLTVPDRDVRCGARKRQAEDDSWPGLVPGRSNR